MHIVDRCRKVYKTLHEQLADPDAQTYFPEEERKSKLRIWLDHFMWIAKHHKINHYYYVHGLDRKNGHHMSDYLSEDMFCRLRNKYNMSVQFGGRKANYICLLGDKFIFGMYLQALGFPVPRVMAICDRDSLTWVDRRQTESLETLVQQDGLDVFIKDLLGECGEGIFSLKVRNGTIFINGIPQHIDELRRNMPDKCLMQARIIQHPQLDILNPHSVNCVRIITARKGNEIIPLSALLKVGSSKSPCDNWAAGGIIIGIDIEAGKLKKDGFYKPAYGRKVTEHPETKVRFEDFEVPCYSECVDLARQVHRYFYGIHSIGWDIAISPQGPVMLEGNERWDTQMQQVHDPRIKSKFLAVLPEDAAQ